MKAIHLIAEMCRRDFAFFCETVWKYVEPGKPFRKAWWFLQLCKVLEKCENGEIRRLILLVAPRHGKSTLVRVLFPAWVLLRNGGKKRFIGATYSNTLTLRDSRKLRDLCEQPFYQQLVSALPLPSWKVRQDAKKLDHWYTTTEGAVHSYGLTGATGEGGDYIMVDDLLSVTIANSKLEREGAIRFYQEVLHSRLDNNPTPGCKIIINQVTNENDLNGHILIELKNREGYEVVCLPTRYEPPEEQKYRTTPKTGFVDQRTKEGEILCPELTSEEFLEETEDISNYIYSAHYQQNPVPRGGGIMKRKDFQHMSREELSQHIPKKLIASYDLSFGKEINKGEDTSYNARVTLQVFQMKLKDGYVTKVFILGGMKNRHDFETMRGEMVEYDRSVEPDFTIVEDAGMAPMMLPIIARQIKPIIQFTPQLIGSKQQRMHTARPIVKGNFYYDPNHETSQMIVDHICKFPYGADDDIADAFSQAAIYLANTRTIRLPDDRDYIVQQTIGNKKHQNLYDDQTFREYKGK